MNWDHFFTVLEKYFLEFQQPHAGAYGSYVTAPYPTLPPGAPMGLQLLPEDVNVLQAMLALIAAVVRWLPQTLRIAVAQSPTWRPLDGLFKLLTCPIPPQLKASLLLAIRMFAMEPALAQKVCFVHFSFISFRKINKLNENRFGNIWTRCN